MRVIICTLALLAFGGAMGQSWCPPGAEWEFYFGSQQAWGITYAHYTGDTLIDGVPFQRIDHTIHAVNPSWMFGQPFVLELPPLYTRYADDVVHIWPGLLQPIDTLMWFGALPGDHWRLHGLWEGDHVTVLDTGRFLLGEEWMRWLVVDVPDWGPDTLRERVGFDMVYLQPELSLGTDFNTIGLKCYSDEILTNSYTGPAGWEPCQFTVGLDALNASSPSPLYPNPGTAHFTLSLPPGPHLISLFDAMGRMVLEQRTAEERPVIGTDHLPAGMYRITVRDERGGVRGMSWVKEG